MKKFFVLLCVLAFAGNVSAEEKKQALFDQIWKEDLLSFDMKGLEKKYREYLKATNKEYDGGWAVIKENAEVARIGLYHTFFRLFSNADLALQEKLFTTSKPGQDLKIIYSKRFKGEPVAAFDIKKYAPEERQAFMQFWEDNKIEIDAMFAKFGDVERIKEIQKELLEEGIIKPKTAVN